MNYLGSITSKRQLTIPISVFNDTNFKIGQKVIIKKRGDSIMIDPASSLVEKLAGSIAVPARFKGMSPDQILSTAKSEHFQKQAR
ncbi:MAG: AbrB/MazE/SpoVT family DNA-binding domain-containing protein [Patescibacteria group bacterium]